MTTKNSLGYIICTSNKEYLVGFKSELFSPSVCFAHVFPYTEDLDLLERLSKTVKGSIKELEVSVSQKETLKGSTFTTVEYILS